MKTLSVEKRRQCFSFEEYLADYPSYNAAVIDYCRDYEDDIVEGDIIHLDK